MYVSMTGVYHRQQIALYFTYSEIKQKMDQKDRFRLESQFVLWSPAFVKLPV